MAAKKSSPRSTPRTSPRTQANRSPRSAPGKKTNTADEVRALVRAGISKEGAAVLANLSSPDIDSHVIDWYSTRALALDALLACPGLPGGRIVMLAGKPHSGKSTAAQMICADVQRRGGIAYYRDREATLDLAYAKRLDVDVDALEILKPTPKVVKGIKQPLSFEDDVEAMEAVIDQLRQFNIPSVIVYDAVGSAATRADLKKKFGERQPGAMAVAIRDMCRRFISKIAGTRIMLVIVNHTYKNIMQMFGSGEVAYGGEGLAYLSSVILHFRRAGKLPDGVEGGLATVTVWKSKTALVTGHKTTVAIARGQGIDNIYTIYTALEENRLISHTHGGWCTVLLEGGKQFRWQGGWPGLHAKLAEEPTLFPRFADAFRALQPKSLGPPVEVPVEASPEGEEEVAAEAAAT